MARCHLLALAFVAASPLGVGAAAPGALKVDNMTIDKVVALPGPLLLKLDKAYAYGEKEDEFKKLCILAAPIKDLLIAEVPVQDYGDKDNSDLAEKLGATKEEDKPSYFFLKGDKFEGWTKFEGFADPRASKPRSWDDEEDGAWEPPFKKEITAENLGLWLRTLGVRVPSENTILELDELVERFLKGGLKDADIAEARKLAEEEFKDDRKAPVYIKIMEKVKIKGKEIINTETARIAKILAGKLTPEKKVELSEKASILGVFSQAMAASA